MFNRLWNLKEQSEFLQRIGALLNEGYNLNEAIEFVSIQLNKNQKLLVEESINSLKNGKHFYEVLKELHFQPTAISYTFYGERNGQLALSLLTAGEILHKRQKDLAEIRKLLAYPIFLLFITGFMFFVIQWQLLPQFMHLYQSFQAEPSHLLRMLLWFNDHPLVPIITILICIIILLVSFYLYRRKHSIYQIQSQLSKLPLIGRIFRLWHTYYISFHMSHLLKNGISLFDTLKIIGKDPQRKYLKDAIDVIQKELLAGKSLHETMKQIPLWQEELSIVIHHGQLSGKLDIELNSYSQYCLRDFSETLEKIVKVSQPLIFGFIAFWIIVMYFSIMLPSFQMINHL